MYFVAVIFYYEPMNRPKSVYENILTFLLLQAIYSLHNSFFFNFSILFEFCLWTSESPFNPTALSHTKWFFEKFLKKDKICIFCSVKVKHGDASGHMRVCVLGSLVTFFFFQFSTDDWV